MGADCHGVLEEGYLQEDTGKMYWTCVATLHINRNYQLFGLLAGVRGDGGEFGPGKPKGMPKDASYQALDEYLLYVDEKDPEPTSEHYCSLAKATNWVAGGSSEWWPQEKHLTFRRITSPDYHSATWLTSEEVRTIVKQLDLLDGGFTEFCGIAAWMTACESPKRQYRVICWFDN